MSLPLGGNGSMLVTLAFSKLRQIPQRRFVSFFITAKETPYTRKTYIPTAWL
jgi:hypothetical protein